MLRDLSQDRTQYVGSLSLGHKVSDDEGTSSVKERGRKEFKKEGCDGCIYREETGETFKGKIITLVIPVYVGKFTKR